MPKKIFIIDDDPDFSEAVSAILQAKGYAVELASNGKEGLDNVRREGADLILLDVMMTKKTEGFDVARSLKRDAATKNIPVILLTGIRKEMNLPFGFEADDKWVPVQIVLEKPIKPEVLLKAIEENLQKK
ncbi:MAG: response regulator [Candidatus Omnitrophota bacterium]